VPPEVHRLPELENGFFPHCGRRVLFDIPTMKTLHAFLSAAVLGTIVGAGCANAPTRYAETLTPAIVHHAPIDQTKRRPDTHPELRTGLFQFTYQQQYSVIEAPEVELQSPYRQVDSGVLHAYNPEVINVAMAEPRGAVIVEAAGAPLRVADDLEGYARELEMRAQQFRPERRPILED
jgi:hypothetical protein